MHPSGAEADDAPPQTFLRDGHSVVQIDRTASFHSVADIQDHFRRYAANRRRNRRHGHSRQMAHRAVARQDKNRPLLIGRREPAKADISTAQSSGQAEASSSVPAARAGAAPSDSLSAASPRDRLPARASHREQPVWFPFVEYPPLNIRSAVYNDSCPSPPRCDRLTIMAGPILPSPHWPWPVPFPARPLPAAPSVA